MAPLRKTLLATGGVALGLAGLGWLVLRRPSFADEVLAQARGDLGVSESKNPGRVAALLTPFGLPATADWCAAAVSAWIRQAASALGDAMPVAGSAGAQALGRQFQSAGRWILPADVPSNVRPGMVAVWSRGDPSSGLGHTGVVSSVDSRGFKSIEGNAQGQAVVENTHAFGETNLLGVGYF